MGAPANSTVQNLLPVQAYFDVQGNFVTFIGQNKPFTAIISPNQSGLNITNSTINSTTIGAIAPSTAVFTSGQVNAAPVNATDIANKQYVDFYAAGLSWKEPVKAASVANIASLSGFQTIDTVSLTEGDRVLVKDQSLPANNGIYIVHATAWTYAVGADDWAEYVGAIVFVEEGSQAYSAWYSLAQAGGTLGVTSLNFANFSVSSTYSAGTGLSLNAGVFSITNTGVAATTYGSATASPVFAVNAQGQITSVTNTTITPAIGNVTGLATGMTTFLQTPTSANLAATVSDETGSGALVFATSPTLVTPALGAPASGNFSSGTFTWPTFNQSTTGNAATATKATNIAGGATGSLPYQSALDTTAFLAAGTNGQVLTLSAGVPVWTTPTTGTVTSVSGAGTVNGLTLTGTVTSSGSLTLGGTLDLSSPPAIGGTTANTVRGTTITATTQFTGAGTGLTGTASGLSIGGNAGTATSATTATNLAGGAANKIAYQTGAGATNFIDAPTVTSSYLGWTGSAFAWSTISAGLTVTDDTTTNATRYLTFTSATSGSITAINTGSTKISINPSTGLLSGIALTLAGTASAAAFKTPNIKEVATVSATAATGTINYDITTQSVLYYTTNASANWTVNFRGSSGTSLDTVMATGESMSATFMVTNGATPYYNSAVNIDGNAITPKWQGGTAPTSGNASSIDIYSYVIIKTGSAAFTVLAAQSQFK